jgi:hypothetical protein
MINLYYHAIKGDKMGFRFRKSIKIAPGVKLNLSKGGVSASVGQKGATVNVGKRGAKATVGLPGSGLSYTQNLTPTKKKSGGIPIAMLALLALFALLAVLALAALILL